MNLLNKVIKGFFNSLMTLVLLIGILFIALYIIGIEPFVVISGSMEPTIHTGSLSFINKHAKFDSVKVRDIIAFTVATGDRVTHRVIKITPEGLETKGDANDVSDGISTTRMNFIGENIFSIPYAGYGIRLIQTPRGKIILGTIIVAILLVGFTMCDDKKGKRYKD